MFFPKASAGRKSMRAAASRFALALALASGAVFASAAIAPAAYAQSNSRGFAAAYAPVAALTGGEAPNWAAARDQFQTLAAAIENEDDRYIAGNMALRIGSNLSDPAWQRRGLEMMLASGKVAPEQIGQFHNFVATLAFNAGDFAAARTAVEAALAVGFTEGDPHGLIMRTYSRQSDVEGGLAYLESLTANGTALEEGWFLTGLQMAYDEESAPQSNRAAAMLLNNFPTAENWGKSLLVMRAVNSFDNLADLEMLRLMRATDSLTNRADFIRYIENADPRIMSNEVAPVLEAAVAAGELTTSDEYYTAVKPIIDARGPQDRSELATTVRDGQRGDAMDAQAAGDVLYSLNDFAQAETMYRAALEKGGEADMLHLRIGISQAMQGNYAGSIETFGQVTGQTQPVAAMWTIFAQSKLAS